MRKKEKKEREITGAWIRWASKVCAGASPHFQSLSLFTGDRLCSGVLGEERRRSLAELNDRHPGWGLWAQNLRDSMKAIKFEQGGKRGRVGGKEGKKRGKAQTMEGWSDACYPGVWSRVCWISLSLFQSLFLCGFVSGGRLKFNWLHRHRCSCLIPFPGLSCLASFLFLSLHLHLCLSPSLTHRVRFSPVNLQAHMPVL